MSKKAGKKNAKSSKQVLEKKVKQDSCRVELVALGAKTPQLPASVFANIAEHLISQCAFMTVASLNIASKAIHTETLPVLFETFFYDDFKRIAIIRNHSLIFPEGIRHTKYVFFTSNDKEFNRLNAFPNVVMTICVDDSDESQVLLLRPVSSATAFTIIQTPFRHSPSAYSTGGHLMCTTIVGLLQIPGLFEPEGEEPEREPFGDMSLPDECLKVQRQPPVRPIVNLNKFVLEKGARLHGRIPRRLSTTRTDLRLHSLELKASGNNESSEDLVATYVELLKVTAMQRDPKHLAEVERNLMEPYGWGITRLGSRTCMMRLKYEGWHVKMALTLPMAQLFVQKLKVEAEANPKILLNRLHITIHGDVEFADMKRLLATLRTIYASHVTGMHHVLPTRAEPPELVRCITRIRMMPATAKTDAVVPLVATELSGSIKVIHKKRGVLVVEEFDKQQHFPHGSNAFIEEV